MRQVKATRTQKDELCLILVILTKLVTPREALFLRLKKLADALLTPARKTRGVLPKPVRRVSAMRPRLGPKRPSGRSEAERTPCSASPKPGTMFCARLP